MVAKYIIQHIFLSKKTLYSIQFQALKICAGSMRSTSLAALQVEIGDPPYQLCRESLITKSFLNLQTFEDSHPAKLSVNDNFMCDYYKKKNLKHNPFTNTARDVLSKNNIDTNYIYSDRECSIPPWQIINPKVNSRLHDIISKQDLPNVINSEADLLLDQSYTEHVKIYTDGSKDPVNNLAVAPLLYLN